MAQFFNVEIFSTFEDYTNAPSDRKEKADLIIVEDKVYKIVSLVSFQIDQNEPEPTFESFDVLVGKIHQWGVDRNIIGEGTVQAQFPKLVEELSEAFIEPGHEYDLIKDGIGDAIVVAIQMAGIGGLSITKPLIAATHNDVSMWNTESYLFEVVRLSGAIGTAVAKNNKKALQALYDRLVYVLSIKAADLGSTLEECLTLAYNEIKDRKGVLYKGAFIKSDDVNYPAIMAELGKTID